jgi:hypothetical protein
MQIHICDEIMARIVLLRNMTSWANMSNVYPYRWRQRRRRLPFHAVR